MITTPRLLSALALAVSSTLGSARAQRATPDDEVREAVSEEVAIEGATGTKVLDLLRDGAVSATPRPGRLTVELAPLSGSVLLLQ